MVPEIPDLVAHCRWCRWLRMECPGCGKRFWNGSFQVVAYPLHYAAIHLGIKVWRRVG
jgi:hypothetical protein